MLSKNLYKIKKSPLNDKKKKTLASVFLVFALFSIVYGVYSFQKLKPADGKKQELKQETGDRPLKKTITIYINADKGLSLRKERNQSSERLVVVPDKTKLEATEELDGWYKVSYSGKEGWVAKQYTTSDVPADDPYKEWGAFAGAGFKVKYPLGWKSKDYGQNTGLKANSVIAFSNQDLPEAIPEGSEFIAPIILKVSSQNLEETKKNYSSISGVQVEAINIGGISGEKYTYTSSSSSTQMTAIVFSGNGKVFVFAEAGGYFDDLLNMTKTFSL